MDSESVRVSLTCAGHGRSAEVMSRQNRLVEMFPLILLLVLLHRTSRHLTLSNFPGVSSSCSSVRLSLSSFAPSSPGVPLFFFFSASRLLHRLLRLSGC